jgi:hypothetical protein
MEQPGIHAPAHKAAGPAGGAFKPLLDFRIGSQQQARDLIVFQKASGAGLFDGSADRLTRPRGHESQDFLKARGGEFVKIAVEGPHDRDPQPVGPTSAKDAEVSRTDDVDQIRLEGGQRLPDALRVAPQQRIEAEVRIHGESGPAALQLKSADRPVLETPGLRPTVNDQQRQAPALSENLVLTASVGGAIYLMERVGE